MSTDSRIPGFHLLSQCQRFAEVERRLGLAPGELAQYFTGSPNLSHLDNLSENVVGYLPLPFSIAPNFRIDGIDVFVPMSTEEPSVVAAATNGAKLLRDGPGIITTVGPAIVVGQVLIEKAHLEAECLVEASFDTFSAEVKKRHPSLAAAGGGLVAVHAAFSGQDLLVSLEIDVQDAMGANIVNDVCEALAPMIEEISGGKALLRVLTNDRAGRLVTACGRVPLNALSQGPSHAFELASRVEAISLFAQRNPARAVTHNKGIFNGIDAVLLATGQDTRAVEASGHAFAAREGTYKPLSSWRLQGDCLVGNLTLPLAVGTVGGAIESRPHCLAALKVMGITRGSARLASIVAAAGLATNLASLLALAGEGIQAGHMRLHSRPVALSMGASPEEAKEVAKIIKKAGKRVERESISAALSELRKRNRCISACAKVILAGEHFVLYGCPAIAVPVPKLTLQIYPDEDASHDDIVLQAYNAARQALGLSHVARFPYRIKSSIPERVGLGSSAALSVALTALAYEDAGYTPTLAELAVTATSVENCFHGRSSGIDPTVVAFRQPVFLEKTGEARPFRWTVEGYELLIAILEEKRHTNEAISRFGEFVRSHPRRFEEMKTETQRLVTDIVRMLSEAGPDDERAFVIGKCMSRLHELLVEAGVSTPNLDLGVQMAISAGAIGAKLTGAGLGGAIIALVAKDRVSSVLKALSNASYTVVFDPGSGG